jgi:ABC-type antimicrobial peptide transport system permease subunit
MVLREAVRLLAIGVAIGMLASLLTGSILRSMLYGTGSRNPLVLALVCLVVGLAGILAACIPALHAASIEPMEALRTE